MLSRFLVLGTILLHGGLAWGHAAGHDQGHDGPNGHDTSIDASVLIDKAINALGGRKALTNLSGVTYESAK
jgi:hypothetical protein